MSPGDPRIDRTRNTVLQATADLVLEVGCERVTIDAIAEASGVARSTIYRNWGDRSALIVEAVERVAEMPDPPDTGSLEGDLGVMAQRLAHNLSEGTLGRILPSLVAAAWCDPEFHTRLSHMADGRFSVCRVAFEQAVVRGEISGADLDGRIERFIAPFFARHLLHGWPLDEAFQASQIAAALRP